MAIANPAQTSAIMTSPLEDTPALPQWFLDYCVRTSKESLEFTPRLMVTDNGDTRADKTSRSDVYTIRRSTYQSIRRLASKSSPHHTPSDTLEWQDDKTNNQWRFTHDGILLKLPAGTAHGQAFLAAAIDQFVKDTESHLIRITIEDVEELVLHFSDGKDVSSIPDLMRRHFAPRPKPFPPPPTFTQPSLPARGGPTSAAETAAFPKQRYCGVGFSLLMKKLRSLVHWGGEGDDASVKAPLLQHPGGLTAPRGYGPPPPPPAGVVSSFQNGPRNRAPVPYIPMNGPMHRHGPRPPGGHPMGPKRQMSVPFASPSEPIIPFPFKAVLQSPGAKGSSAECEVLGPLVIHVVNADRFVENNWLNILHYLRETIAGSGKSSQIIVIATTENPKPRKRKSEHAQRDDDTSDSSDDEESTASKRAVEETAKATDDLIISKISNNGDSYPIRIMPMWIKATHDLLEEDEGLENYRQNVRRLQRKIMACPSVDRDSPFLSPYNEWSFLRESHAMEILKKEKLAQVNVDSIAHQVSHDLEANHVIKTIEQVGQATEALEQWERSQRDSGEMDQWTNFPLHVQKVVKNVSKLNEEGQRFYWESKLLGTLIDPGTLEHTWSDIELKSSTRLRVIQLVDQILSEPNSHYGIFATGRINGALIYGPPGTGKTHLARVLAKESKTTMLLATVADIEGSMAGQTEKAIKALFNLARMCSPSIVFIDEADALFQSRKGLDMNWERSRLSQFLIETDGLRKRDSEPFLILATNHPFDLDHAVFRRVPARIYIGLPSTEARERIFEMCLKDEDVDSEVSMKALAAKTSRFSASDIRTFCVQAALVCQAELDDAGRSWSRRQLRMSHFTEALRSCGSTVSKADLDELREFAREFDRSALSTMHAYRRVPAGAQT